VTAPKDIKRLVERFQENSDVYCSGAYNETQARHEFIDPLVHTKSPSSTRSTNSSTNSTA